MTMIRMLSGADISASGMAAERMRMEVVANNLANAHSTRSQDGGPYRRREVVFQSVAGSAGNLGGVKVLGIRPDASELPKTLDPGHPDADEQGFVTMTNVKPAFEMVDLITASRSYEANLRALRTFREMAEQALTLLRGA